ncbi:class I adenylate-forming enzyme family protein [Virgisporangium ochraceum]|uniref:AMP-dependent synthetase n=1 Tax=Virgisporangium ochraceum TaxID=65505 RepID=A0A8J4A412_9ACTN|nr:AMP-binding protein [Virgisporangium ochraceum]GIJ72366.1 AMP-dependent synthetase [Virgisporangium ochraceum]
MTPAVTGPSGTVTHRELADRVAAAARGLAPGVRFAVCEPDPLDTIVAVLAADRAGATAVVVDAAWSPAQRRRALSTSGVTGTAPSPSTSATPFWVGFTSGSAGTPRPIARTSASWTSSYPLVSERTGIRAGRTVGIPGPLASSLFLFGTLHALWAGAHVVAPGRWDPAAMDGLDAVHCVPTMLADLLDLPTPPPVAVCGGAALPTPVRDRARSRGVRIADYYGATELSFVAWGTPDGRLEPLPDVEVEVRSGEIWVRGPYLSLGYAADVDGPLRWDGAGFATVGDLGTLHDGTLRVLGRGDGTIMCGGTPVLPQDVEHVLLDLPSVRDAVVVGTPHDRLGAVVTAVIEPVAAPPTSPHPSLLASLRAATRERLAAPQRPRHWYVMPSLPRTGAGKVARTAVAEAVRTGTLAARRLR